jgi:hypothetical protein
MEFLGHCGGRNGNESVAATRYELPLGIAGVSREQRACGIPLLQTVVELNTMKKRAGRSR